MGCGQPLRKGIASATGFDADPAAVRAALPDPEGVRCGAPRSRRGFGVETGLTIDLLRKGFRVREVQVDMPTG